MNSCRPRLQKKVTFGSVSLRLCDRNELNNDPADLAELVSQGLEIVPCTATHGGTLGHPFVLFPPRLPEGKQEGLV